MWQLLLYLGAGAYTLYSQGTTREETTKAYLDAMNKGEDLPDYEYQSMEWHMQKGLIKRYGYKGKPKAAPKNVSTIAIPHIGSYTAPKKVSIIAPPHIGSYTAPTKAPKPFRDQPVNIPVVVFLVVAVLTLCIWGLWPRG